MKKKVFFMAALSALLVACTSTLDVPEEDSPHLSDDRSEVKFTFSGFSGGEVPYTNTKATTPAYGDESKIERMDVYVFQDDKFEEVFSNVTLHGSGNERTATIGLKGKNLKDLFFVANGDYLSLKTLVQGVTTDTEFIDLLTDQMPADTKEPLACPLLLTGSVTVIQPATAPISVTLKRTVARFDVENDARITNFYLKYVTLNNINTQAYIYNNGTKRYVTSTLTKPYVWNKVQYTLRNNANTGLVNSLFYLYPQEGGTIADGGAYLTIEGEVGEYPDNAKVAFDVPLFDKAAGKAIDITANTRYVLKINSASNSTVDATISTKAWVNESNVDEGLDSGMLQLTDKDGNLLTSADLTLNAGNPDEITKTFNVKATTEWEFTPELPTWVKITEKVIDGKGICTKFKLSVAKNQHAATRSGVVTLRNKIRPSISQGIVVQQTGGTPDLYPGTTLAATEVAGIIWAPVNVGDTDLTKNGHLFQWGRGDAPFAAVVGDPDPASVVGPLSSSAADKTKFVKLEIFPLNPLALTYRNTFIGLCKTEYKRDKTAFDAYNIKNYDGMHAPEWNSWYEAEVRNNPTVRDAIITLLNVSSNIDVPGALAGMMPPYDWNIMQDNNLWNLNDEVATGVNPCPKGWRVPTQAEYDRIFNTKNVSFADFVFTDKYTSKTVSFLLPEAITQISASGEINHDGIESALLWTSESVLSSAVLDYTYDPATKKDNITRAMDVYKSKYAVIGSKNRNFAEGSRAEGRYVRCVLND